MNIFLYEVLFNDSCLLICFIANAAKEFSIESYKIVLASELNGQ